MEIIEKKLDNQIIDCRPETSFRTGSISQSINLPYTSVMSNHSLKDLTEITAAFKKAGVDINKKMIFIGGAGATAVKAAADHVGYPGSKSIFDVNMKEWIANRTVKV